MLKRIYLFVLIISVGYCFLNDTNSNNTAIIDNANASQLMINATFVNANNDDDNFTLAKVHQGISINRLKSGLGRRHSECDLFKNFVPTDMYQLHIFAIGTINETIMIINDDYSVFEVPLENATMNQLNLISPSTPLSVKYPLLYNDHKFIQSMGIFYKVFFFKDNQSMDYLSITTQANNSELLNGSLIYNINNGQINAGLNYDGLKDEILLSTDFNLVVYSVKKENDEVKLGSYSIVGEKLPQMLQLNKKYRSICLLKNNILTINPIGKKCNEPAKWNVVKGFTARNKFYLIDSKMVYIFDTDLFDNEEKEYSFEQISLDKFFKCPNNYEYSSVALIIIWIIIIIILICIFMLFCQMYTSKRFGEETMDKNGYDLKDNLDSKQAAVLEPKLDQAKQMENTKLIDPNEKSQRKTLNMKKEDSGKGKTSIRSK